MTAANAPLLQAILDLVRELPGVAVQAIARDLREHQGSNTLRKMRNLGATQSARTQLANIATLSEAADLPAAAVALALEASAHTFKRDSQEEQAEVAWTGPSTEAVPLRRVDQVLYELVATATSELLLVTYAAYKAERALAALREASDRGVEVTLVMEPSKKSGGKIRFDGLRAIRSHVPRARVLYWPLEKRSGAKSGAYGAMHVKCLIVDRSAGLVSSANLTDHALELNMELGVLLRGKLASRLAAHYDQLIARGELVPVGGS